MGSGDNVLDSSAIEAIKRIEKQVALIPAIKQEQAVMVERLANVEKSVRELPELGPYVTDLRVTGEIVRASTNRIEDNEKDIKAIRKEQGEIKEDVREVKTNQRWYAGGGSALAVIIATVINAVKPTQ